MRNCFFLPKLILKIVIYRISKICYDKTNKNNGLHRGGTMKKFIIIGMCIILSVVALSACNSNNDDNNNQTNNNAVSQTPQTADECITWLADVQKESDDITLDIKIPQIKIDKPGAQSINEEIKAKFYTEDVKSAIDGGFDGVQVFTRTETTLHGNILSIRIKAELYPSYGTDGEIYTVCYDVKTDTLLTPAQVLKQKGHTYEKAMQSLRDAYDEQVKDYTEFFELAGVFIDEEGKVEMVATSLIHPQQADAWKTLFYHTLA